MEAVKPSDCDRVFLDLMRQLLYFDKLSKPVRKRALEAIERWDEFLGMECYGGLACYWWRYYIALVATFVTAQGKYIIVSLGDPADNPYLIKVAS